MLSFKKIVIVTFLVFGVVPSLMILSETDWIKYIGITFSILFFLIAILYYKTFRNRGNRDEDLVLYKKAGLAVFLHSGIMMFPICATLFSGFYYHGFLMLMVISLTLYEGWRGMNGWNLFIPQKNKTHKITKSP